MFLAALLLLPIGAFVLTEEEPPAEQPVVKVEPPTVTPLPLEPYGGCDEAWQAPDSPGANDCRALGWTVTSEVVIPPGE